MKKNIFFIAILGIIFAVTFQVFNPKSRQSDFLAYWSAAHLFISGGNPYDQSAMSILQQSIMPEEFSHGGTVINAWNPPWFILIFSPLGGLSYSSAISAWVFVNTLLVGLALIITWQMCGAIQNSRGMLIVFVVGYLFGETIAYLAIGQITVLVLLGMVLSIWWSNHHFDLLAGAVLLLAFIKPQISFFFLLIFLLWIIQHKRWKIIVGFIIATLTSLIIFWIVIPNWVSDYINLLSTLPDFYNYTSTVGSFVESIFHIKFFNYSAILLLFFIKPIIRILEKDGWLTAMNISLLISLPLSPFGFSFDQIVILPSIVQVIAWLWSRQLSTKISTLVIGSLIVFYAVVLKLLSINNLEYYWFFIVPLLLLAIYLIPWKYTHVS